MKEILRKNLSQLIEDIELERLKYSPHQIIKLVAVSKYASVQEIINLYSIGHRAFGENKIQSLKEKIQATSDLPLEWHMIGNLQENKINQMLKLKPFMFHSLDSIKLANSLQKRLEAANQKLACLLQINTSFESTKSGVNPNEAIEIYEQIETCNKNIILKGIMTMGPNTDEKNKIEKAFKIAKDIFDKLKGKNNIFSCGMSNDYKIAIANGANMLRIGSKIFKN